MDKRPLLKTLLFAAWALAACALPLFAQDDAAAENPQSEILPAAAGSNPPSSPFPGIESVSPAVLMRRAPATLTLRAAPAEGGAGFTGTVPVAGLWRRDPLDPKKRVPVSEAAFENGEAALEGAMALDGAPAVNGESLPARVLPGWLSILPPVLAIGLAVAFRQVIIALVSGVYAGALFLTGFDPLAAFLRTADAYVVGALADSDHAHILVFTFLMGGTIAVISRSGGTQGIVDALARYARSARTTQLATWAMGVVIFFDDYANCLIVGNTMRPFTDKLRVSREKLSYIVDATAASDACIAIASTWVGFQLGFLSDYKDNINAALAANGMPASDAYGVFIRSIPYSYYSLLTIFFVFLLAATLRDFGPMLRAERRARATGQVLRPGGTPLAGGEIADLAPIEGKPCRWVNAVLPVAALVFVTLAGLYATGRDALGEAAASAGWIEIIGSANSYKVLVWAAFASSLAAVLLAVGQRILSLDDALAAWTTGVKSMVLAVTVLVLAWALGDICRNEMLTGSYLVEMFRDTLPPALLPMLIFLIAAAISFATGTSWGTMAILFPIAIPMACVFLEHGAVAPHHAGNLLYGTIAAVLSGAIFGDHCSPISDTTILSSMASSCDHIDHVRTQLPYGLAVAGVSAAFGYVPVGFGFSPWWGLLLGMAALTGILFAFGKRVEDG